MFKNLINEFKEKFSALKTKYAPLEPYKIDPALKQQYLSREGNTEAGLNKRIDPPKQSFVSRAIQDSRPPNYEKSTPVKKEIVPPTPAPVPEPVLAPAPVQPAPKPAPVQPDVKIASVPEDKRIETRIEQTPEVTAAWEQAGRPATNPYMHIIKDVFGDRAEDMNDILRWGKPDDQGYRKNYGGENLSYNTNQPNDNNNGSKDLGLFQINSNTFADFMRRKPDIMKQNGLDNFDQMNDPKLNTLMAKIIFDEQGYSAWYGRPSWLN